MKITIDTTFKTIEILEQISMVDFIEHISKILPEWKEYKLIPPPVKVKWQNQWPYTFTDKMTTFPFSPPYIPQPLAPYNPMPIWGGGPTYGPGPGKFGPAPNPLIFGSGTGGNGEAITTTSGPASVITNGTAHN